MAKKVISLAPTPKVLAVTILFVLGGLGLYLSVEPFIETLQKWSLAMGISTFVFVQWVAPFLSEFPEKVTAFNWARQRNKAGMGVMNMVNSNINQWTMLAAMIPLVFSLSLGKITPVQLDSMHWSELALTISQSFLGGLLLLDLRFSFFDAFLIFILWLVQFIYAPLREEITWIYMAWSLVELGKAFYLFAARREVPKAWSAMKAFQWTGSRR